MASLVVSGDTSGAITLSAPSVAGTNTLSLPAQTATLATLTTPSFATTIGVGGATAAASGAGITFPATASASSDANTLDDYEEGTFTPTFDFSSGAGTLTYSDQVGRYTKVGSVVTVQALLVVSAKGTASGNISLDLPFTAAASVYGAASLTWNGITYSANSYTIVGQIGNNTVNLDFYNEPSGGSKTSLTASQCNSSFEIIFTVTYRVA